jgi:hypothetical protein
MLTCLSLSQYYSHRLRMGSSPRFAGNAAFGTIFLVCVPSYYFCVKKRDFKEKWIELIMKANDVQPAKEMPLQPTENPFLSDEEGTLSDKELYGRLEERKEWQIQTPTQDAKQVFQEIPKK